MAIGITAKIVGHASGLGVGVFEAGPPARRVLASGACELGAAGAGVLAALGDGSCAADGAAAARRVVLEGRPVVLVAACEAGVASALSAGDALCVHEAGRAASAVGVLAELAGELASVSQAEEDLESFTDHLSHAYETISLLYRLGRLMGDVRQPERFTDQAIGGLLELLGFNWGAMVFGADPRRCGPLAGTLRVIGELDIPDRDARILAAIERPARELRTEEGPVVLRCDDPTLGREVLVHEIANDQGVCARLVMGGKFGVPCTEGTATSFDTQAAEAMGSYIGAVVEGGRLYAEQESTLLGTLRALTGSLDAKDRYTRGHSERVAVLGRLLGRAVGLPVVEVDKIYVSGTLHDLGKIGVPDRVLCKPGRLTDEEFELIRAHPVIGYDILSGIPSLEEMLPGVRHHHERWDGRGYPDGLAGEETPLMARVLAVADMFDAMSSTRSYRAARTRAEVLAEVERVAGSQLDPELARVFLGLDLSEYDALMARHLAEAAATQRVDAAA